MSWTNWYLPIGCPNVSRSRAYSTDRSRHARITPQAPAATVKRPWSSAYMAISNPWPSSPTRFSAGTSTFSKKSSPVDPAQMPSLCSVSRVVTPGHARSTTNAEMPLCRRRRRDEDEPGAAVLLRDHDPEQPELGHSLDHAHVEPVLDVVLDRVRQDALVDERAHGVLNQPLLICKVEIHGGESMEALRRASGRDRAVRARAAGEARHARLHARHDRRAPGKRRL